jgi:hypothetical protein
MYVNIKRLNWIGNGVAFYKRSQDDFEYLMMIKSLLTQLAS